MDELEFWKNFRLGEELHIAGTFIYNGLRQFHELQHLENTDEVFEFLYNLSVGFERLLKVAVVLHEHSPETDQDALEKSLITHSHMELIARLKKHVPSDFPTPQNDLLQLLTEFYISLRYDRFSLNSIYEGKKESAAIRGFLSKHLKIELPEQQFPFSTANKDRFRKFISRTVQKISQTIYGIINKRSSAINLYTYELRNASKAQSVFLGGVEIADEDVLWKELLIFFMNVEPTNGYLRFLKEIRPLDFDPLCTGDYLDCFRSNAAKAEVMDELEHHYGEMEPDERKERLKKMKVIGAPNVYFGDPEDDEEPPYGDEGQE